MIESRTWTCARCRVEFGAAVSASPDLDLLCPDCTELVHTPRYGLPKFRRRLGLTQARLAELLGVPKRTVENWESCGSGYRRPPAYLSRALLDVERELQQAV